MLTDGPTLSWIQATGSQNRINHLCLGELASFRKPEWSLVMLCFSLQFKDSLCILFSALGEILRPQEIPNFI